MGPDDIVDAVAARTEEVVAALRALDDGGLRAPSALPGWSRLTIACHLRYGADAFDRMTRAAVAGEAVSYYPEGRDQQRPGTLVPGPGESPPAVVASLEERSRSLDDAWRSLEDDQWSLDVVEPEARTDLGTLPLRRLPLLRLTEVEVHGSDLDLGLGDWSRTFVEATLPFRLQWLNARRTNHRAVDDQVAGTWLLRADDGPAWLVTVQDDTVHSRPADESGLAADAVIEASSRDLLALLLGRPFQEAPRLGGDTDLAAAFSRAFPGP